VPVSEDPALELEAEVSKRRRRAIVVALTALCAFPLLVFAVYLGWQHVRLGLVGGLALGLLLTHRTVRKAFRRRGG